MKTERLEIESISENHAHYLFPAMSDRVIYDHVDEEPFASESELAKRYAFLAKGSPKNSNETWLNWAVKLRSRGSYIGTLQATAHTNGQAEIAYMFSPNYWFKGYATEATAKLCDFLFSELNISEIIVSVDVNNAASIRLAERLGFRHTETRDCKLKGEPAQEHLYLLQHN